MGYDDTKYVLRLMGYVLMCIVIVLRPLYYVLLSGEMRRRARAHFTFAILAQMNSALLHGFTTLERAQKEVIQGPRDASSLASELPVERVPRIVRTHIRA